MRCAFTSANSTERRDRARRTDRWQPDTAAGRRQWPKGTGGNRGADSNGSGSDRSPRSLKTNDCGLADCVPLRAGSLHGLEPKQR
jgi:hypothetical protein